MAVALATHYKKLIHHLYVIIKQKRPWVFFLGCSLIWLGMLRGEKGIIDAYKLNRSKLVLLNEIQKIENEISFYEKEIKAIKGSDAYARKIFADKFNLTREGETIVLFDD